MKIRILDDRTINQVAAGEVIESPASVVKELVENALDAEATVISIEIISGGRNLIRIHDNGVGMTKDNVLLAFERHATSKISKLNDLDQIGTMGFRGEALPSIASVAKCSLSTSTGEDSSGTKICIHGGKVLSCEPHVQDRGTHIEVRSLFFNVPVRRKFQKSVGRDIQSVIQIFTELSLANPTCRFSLKSEGKKVLDIKAIYADISEEKVRTRTLEVLGEHYFTNSHFFKMEAGVFKSYGLMADPLQTRGNRSGQHIYINGRSIQSPLISKVIRRAYGTRISSQRHPVFLLHLNLPPSLVDVNVHPQKKEVRFREEDEIESFLIKLVEEALRVPLEYRKTEDVEHAPIKKHIFERTAEPLKSSSPKIEEKSPWEAEEEMIPAIVNKKEVSSAILPLYDLKLHGSLGAFLMISSGYIQEKMVHALNEVQAGNVWIMLHQRRAKFRIFYEKLNSKGRSFASQRLLLPIHLTLSNQEMLNFESLVPILETLGFSIRLFGSSEYLIEEVPNFLSNLSMDTWIKDLLHTHEGKSPENDLRDHLRVQIALRASMSKNASSDEEKKALIEDLCMLEEWMRTPLGKPIFSFLSEEDLKKKYFA